MGEIRNWWNDTKYLWERRFHGEVVTAPDGQVFDISPTTHDHDYHGIRAGNFERAEREVLGRNFQRDGCIVEIGANIGITARYGFLEKLKDDGVYICIEPNPNALATLYKNMRRAQAIHPDKEFRVIAAAIAEPGSNASSGEFVLRSTLGSGLVSHIRQHAGEAIVLVPMRSLSSILDEHAPSGASLICDAEGAEHLLLQDKNGLARIR